MALLDWAHRKFISTTPIAHSVVLIARRQRMSAIKLGYLRCERSALAQPSHGNVHALSASLRHDDRPPQPSAVHRCPAGHLFRCPGRAAAGQEDHPLDVVCIPSACGSGPQSDSAALRRRVAGRGTRVTGAPHVGPALAGLRARAAGLATRQQRCLRAGRRGRHEAAVVPNPVRGGGRQRPVQRRVRPLVRGRA